MAEKPVVYLVGEDGNIFNLVGICSQKLNREGLREEAKELNSRLWECESYNQALNLMKEYVIIR